MSSRGDINGIRRVDLETRGPWRRRIWWWMGGPIAASKTGLTVWRKVAAPIEAPLMKASRGRLKLNPAVPMVVLTTRAPRAANVGRFHLLTSQMLTTSYSLLRTMAARAIRAGIQIAGKPTCELHRGPLGGPFIASVAEGADRDRLYALAVDRLSRVFALHDKRSGDATTIPVMRLTLLQGEHEGQQTDGDVVEFRFQATSGQQKK